MLKFFLYHLTHHTTVFGRELYHALAQHPNRTQDYYSADFFITTVGNECNYPNFDMRGCTTPTPLARFAETHKFYKLKPHVVFLHTTPKDLLPGLINIAYVGPGIVIPPPAITRVPFGKAAREPRVYFQGTTARTPKRKKIIASLGRTALVKEKGTKEEYRHYLKTSEYALVVSGDLPWSYRLTEVIQSGAIPFFVNEDNHPLPMSDEIDWVRCAEFVSINDLKNWVPNKTAAALKRNYLLEIHSKFAKVREIGNYIVRAVSNSRPFKVPSSSQFITRAIKPLS